jgi:RimJ/RimL family protein N-acetyltransferase
VATVDDHLTTERLMLRPVTTEDHAALQAHWGAPDVRRFLFDGATEVDEGNAAPVAVIKRLGMTAFDVVPGLLGPMTRYRRTAQPA